MNHGRDSFKKIRQKGFLGIYEKITYVNKLDERIRYNYVTHSL
jgi:hypothetical protein